VSPSEERRAGPKGQITLVEAVPKTSVGKFDKKMLRER